MNQPHLSFSFYTLAVPFLLGLVGMLSNLNLTSKQESDHFLGQWNGIITQVEPYSIKYFDMEMGIAKDPDDGTKYNVRSHVRDGKYHAFMAAVGTLNDAGDLVISESEIIRYDSIPNMEWCLKQLVLQTAMEEGDFHLKGEWTGQTSFGNCIPGKVDLVRGVIRP